MVSYKVNHYDTHQSGVIPIIPEIRFVSRRIIKAGDRLKPDNWNSEGKEGETRKIINLINEFNIPSIDSNETFEICYFFFFLHRIKVLFSLRHFLTRRTFVKKKTLNYPPLFYVQMFLEISRFYFYRGNYQRNKHERDINKYFLTTNRV